MESFERRDAILILLFRRKHETIANWASEFEVSYSTIRRDIDILSCKAPLVMKSGRYDGGVYIADFDKPEYPVTAEDEIHVLHKILNLAEKELKCILSKKELNAVNALISQLICHNM